MRTGAQESAVMRPTELFLLWSNPRHGISSRLRSTTVPGKSCRFFVSIDWDDRKCAGSSDNLWNNASKLKTTDCPLVQCVVHPRTSRSRSSHVRSDLIGRTLVIEEERRDILVEPGGELLLGSKLGGRPYYYYGTFSYIKSLDDIFEQGSCLLLQYTKGGYEPGCPFLSPFGEYNFICSLRKRRMELFGDMDGADGMR